jgi:hypothetical protein
MKRLKAIRIANVITIAVLFAVVVFTAKVFGQTPRVIVRYDAVHKVNLLLDAAKADDPHEIAEALAVAQGRNSIRSGGGRCKDTLGRWVDDGLDRWIPISWATATVDEKGLRAPCIP